MSVEEFRATRISGPPTDPKVLSFLQMNDWELMDKQNTKVVHCYELVDIWCVIEERHIGGEVQFAYLFIHPAEKTHATLAAAEQAWWNFCMSGCE